MAASSVHLMWMRICQEQPRRHKKQISIDPENADRQKLAQPVFTFLPRQPRTCVYSVVQRARGPLRSGINMSKFTLPELSPDQRDVFEEAFAKDLDFLKAIPKENHPSYDLFVRICYTKSVSLLTEAEGLALQQLTDPSEKQTEILNSVKEKGPKGILMFYLFLNMNNEDIYGELPSSKENDKKLDLISNLRDGFLESLKKSIQLSRFSGPARPTASVAPVTPISPTRDETEEKPKESNPKDVRKVNRDSQQATERSRGKEKEKKEEESPDEDERPRPRSQRKSWGIRKDDEFFHFIIICFAVGASLVCSYNYADWTVSAGIGLISFASLETIGFYFGLIHRIRSVVEAFLPLLRKAPLPGLPKQG
ncbi:transmembrane protein 40 [Spea bombifrons]|uniref:transmembrane protein 40 n=1 Tax=Spea bombifrons TaxID=233779 RepID=UPI0023491385|nr:transmembrane protein 40 [Spea bombifrons]